MTDFILEANNLEFSYLDGTKAIKNLSINIVRGKKVALVGNNGAGKTTLFLHFNGVHRPSKGVIRFKGEKIDYSNKQLKELRKSIGIVFQDPDNQLFSASVYQDVSFGPINLGWPEAVVREKVEQAMQKTSTWSIKDKPTHFLSHGQKKRVAIAGILAMEPEIIILDEPTAGLDPVGTGQMMQLLDQFNQTGATVILTSHNLDEVYAWADDIFVMENGNIIAQGNPEEIFRNEEVLRRANLVKPWVLEVYDHLVAKNMIRHQPQSPRNREQLKNLLG
ncbi:energy-coupling factor ABC transporter ATP-binding protein [Candidatus Formimonas warabiya]|uniref:energy-coupling factor ABC transporter ATP-binding protein n=1 Tax=Formimonas warabiya TaxID=1761012 RepID=UPI0011D0BAD8|nr:ATP-binding cassette domain-containing protein [Candidatus Formimonas warabiya]